MSVSGPVLPGEGSLGYASVNVRTSTIHQVSGQCQCQDQYYIPGEGPMAMSGPVLPGERSVSVLPGEGSVSGPVLPGERSVSGPVLPGEGSVSVSGQFYQVRGQCQCQDQFYQVREGVFDIAFLIRCGADSDLLFYNVYVLMTFESP